MQTAPQVLENPTQTQTIKAQALIKRYGDFTAVDGIDFTTFEGECFGFLGPNGAGKTSTMGMIGCASPVTGGHLQVLGLDVNKGSREIKAQLGVVLQEDCLDEELTVRENLRVYGRYFSLPGSVVIERLETLIDFMQLRDKADVNVRFLSGGLRRRLTIARALISEPKVLILDEPTTGLDPQARHLVWEKLRQLKSQERTLILTTHYMDEAEQLCDRLVVMEHGKFIAQGKPRELIQEHVAPSVVEVTAALPLRQEILESIEDLVSGYEMLADRLLLFARDGEALLHTLTASSHPDTEFYARRATLEDVFLKLTGRSLNE